MNILEIYWIIIVLIIFFYGLPLLLIKGKQKIFLSLGAGCGIFFLFSGIFVLFMKLFNLDNGEYPFFEKIAIALFISLPFVLVVNLVLALLYYFFWYRNKYK